MHRIKHEFFMHHRHETTKRASQCQHIHSNQCAPPAAEETRIQNRPLRPALRSDLGLGRRSSEFSRSRNTNPREERVSLVRISRDIRYSRGRSSLSIEEGLIGNRLLRLVLRSDFGLGRRSIVFMLSRSTKSFAQCLKVNQH